MGELKHFKQPNVSKIVLIAVLPVFNGKMHMTEFWPITVHLTMVWQATFGPAAA